MSRVRGLGILIVLAMSLCMGADALAQKAVGPAQKAVAGPGITLPGGDRNAPSATVLPVPLDMASSIAANNIRMYYSNAGFPCIQVPLQLVPALGSVTLFQRQFTTTEASSLVAVQLSTEPYLLPASINGTGIAMSCAVEQDTDGDSTWDTISYCSGTTATFSPWLSFFPHAVTNTASTQTAYNGWAPVAPSKPTRVTITLLGQTFGNLDPSGFAYACNSNLKIEY